MDYSVDKFADVEILRYEVKGFEELSLRQKKLVYFLTEAALWGRDILFDQNGVHNLCIMELLEHIYLNYKGDRETPEWNAFTVYLKRVWFASGIHHHYSCDKFVPGFTPQYLDELISHLSPLFPPDSSLLTFHLSFFTSLFPIIFDPDVLPKRVNQADGEDLVVTSASNYYEDVTQQEAEAFYDSMKQSWHDKAHPLMFGMNSRLTKDAQGRVVEEVWKVGGMYSAALEKIVYWLKKAEEVAENDSQRRVISLLIQHYQTGSLETFDEYSIAWLKDTSSRIDFVNGFIETYGDPLGLKASWESIVNFKDLEATRRTETISSNAQWFEDNSPVDARFKKETVKGVSAKVITAAILAGDLYPASAIGINLPNSNWIRAVHGSKSVTIGNLTEAYSKAAKGNGFREEFAYSDEEVRLIDKYACLTDDLHTDLHECLGHGSGKLLPGVDPDALKAYGATIEEARADLFGLYYLPDKKLLELGLLPDNEAYKAEYYSYMMNGLLTQAVRIELGRDIEEAHMRNRQLIARWALEHGKDDNVVELVVRNSKTYVKVNSYEALRRLFGMLLAEVQRIKSEGDYEAARSLVENYGVHLDPKLHAEVLERYRHLNLAPYKGFVNPVYTPVLDDSGEIIDVKISYDEGYTEQMLRYSRDYSTL